MARHPSRILRLAFMLGFFLSATSLRLAAQETPPWCTPAMLDVQVLPLVQGTTQAAASLLVVEFQNRSQIRCRLQFDGTLAPEPDPNMKHLSASSLLESVTGPASALADQHAQLDPGGVVHVVFVWSGKPLTNGGCYDFDSLNLTVSGKPLLTVSHLWAHACNGIRGSQVRLGPYVPDEPLPDEWMRQSNLQMTDFRVPISPVARNATSVGGQSEASLYTFFDHAMLGDYFAVLLNLPQQALPGCPFHVMRRRYADGDTTAYLSRCDTKIGDPKVFATYAGQTETRTLLHLRAFGLEPAKVGPVEFDTISQVLRGGAPVFVRARAAFAIKDPSRLELPVIESTVPPCRAEQLTFTRLPTLLNGKWHRADVYEAANASGPTCLLGGVPQFQKALEKGFARTCPNCPDPLFQPRPSGWIDLRSGESAHFLIGTSRFNTDVERWMAQCDETQTLELTLPGDNRVVPLPFGAGACAEINASAWRTGPYDSDPMNAQFDRRTEAASLNANQIGCGDAPLPPTAQSVVLSTRDNFAFCVSVDGDHFVKGEPVPVTVWAGNQTEVAQNATSCGTFGTWAVDFYDFYGHRVLERSEQEALNRGPSEVSAYDLPICARNVSMSIPPHTWVRVNGQPHTLPPGRYFIVEEPARVRNSQGNWIIPRPGISDSTPKLTVSIEQP
jgi:hypothetical protein